MNTLRRTIVPVVLVSMLGAACTTGGDEDPSALPTTPSCAPGECVLSSDVGDVEYQPGRYSYAFNDVSATFSMEGSTGTLEVKNGSSAEIGKPGMYIVSGDDRRLEGTVDAAAAIAGGEEATFTVTFADDVDPAIVGLVVLLFGGSNFGAMSPVPVS